MWSQAIDDIRQTEEYVSIYDFIAMITRSKNPRTEWARLQSRAPGICARIPLAYVQFAGSGQRVTACTNAAGARVLGQLLLTQQLDRAERSLARVLKIMEKTEDTSLLAQLTAALGTARALRASGRVAAHTTP